MSDATRTIEKAGSRMPLGNPDSPVCRVLLLGSTGSIGTQAVDVITHLNTLNGAGSHPVRYEVVGLGAGANASRLAEQVAYTGAGATSLAQGSAQEGCGSTHFAGPDGTLRLVEEVECDLVLGAVVGAAGLPAILRAVGLGRDIAIANKETLVAAGSIVMDGARRSGSRMLPVDSEHSAVWQGLMSAAGPGYAPPAPAPGTVRRAILTASGGAFRDRSRAEIEDATPEQALAHPTWSMGAKVTIDSATLINRALELIEAHWLFDLPNERLDVLIHRQSAVHALVEFVDGSLMAQMGPQDMRLPIQLAMTAPQLVSREGCPGLDLARLACLDFEEVDPDRFPAIGLARHVIETGGTSGAIFNASNEVAVGAFLSGRIPFGRIDRLVAEVVGALGSGPVSALGDVLEADARARRETESRVARS